MMYTYALLFLNIVVTEIILYNGNILMQCNTTCISLKASKKLERYKNRNINGHNDYE